MKEVLLVLLGAFISCATTWLLDWLRCNREEKIHHKRMKEEVYVEMQDFVVECCAHWRDIKTGRLSNDIRIRYNNIRSKAHIYGKKEIVDKFYDIADDMMHGKNTEELGNGNDELIKMIQKDLNIKD